MRFACCVPHCGRTTRRAVEPPDNVWICSVHWREVPRAWKAVKRRARAALRRRPDDPGARRRYLRLSRRVTRLAVERGLGLS